MKKKIFLTLLGLFLINLVYAQYEIPPVPKEQTSVYDYINLLSDSQASHLEEKLIRYSDTTSTQIVVLIIDTTKGENINYLAANWGEKWGIGQEKEDNGVIVLLARKDRKVAISTGRGVEGRLTDLMSKRIIDSRIIPEFKKGDYYKGLDKGTDGIFEVLQGEFKETKKRAKKGINRKWIVVLIIIGVMLIIIGSNMGKGRRKGKKEKRKKSSGLSVWDAIILSNMGSNSWGSGDFGGGSSSGGFGGSGSGGFSGGFGGGSFGGGGASGSW